ncbi:MAG: hypothetical protein OK436_06090, partial [Thaumarchaeota archaeon]|nr:hypothetical protein [Nitrososphaerota archaeon]
MPLHALDMLSVRFRQLTEKGLSPFQICGLVGCSKDLFFILEKVHLLPSFILEVMIYVGRNAEMTRYVQVIVRSLKVF